MNRRQFLAAAAAATCPAPSSAAPDPDSAERLGVSIASYSIRMRAAGSPLSNALDLLEHCHGLGAGGVQIGVQGWDQEGLAKALRTRAEMLGLFLEGQIRLPDSEADGERFSREIATAKESGVVIFRSVMLNGRRYETFASLADWKAFERTSWEQLARAEPIVAKHQVVLAVENHKDWRIDEMLGILSRLSSEHVGVNLDIGNNIALLEDPLEVAEALAPHIVTTHFKDMGVETYPDGFLLAEVPLGEGYLDLQRIIDVCRSKNPKVRLNLEMITRDPLKIPCLTDAYWTTLGEVKGRKLAQALRQVREQRVAEGTLARVAHLPLAEQIALEEEHVRRSFHHARTSLRV